MANDNEWTVVFYREENGRSPVREFLMSLDMKTKACFNWSIEQLRIRNVRAQEPLVRHLEGSSGSYEKKVAQIFIDFCTSFFQVGALSSCMASKKSHRRPHAMKLK